MFVCVIGYIDGHIDVIGPFPSKPRANQHIDVLPVGAYRAHVMKLIIPEHVVHEITWLGERH